MNRLEELRKQAKITQDEIAEKLRIAKKTYYSYAHGKAIPSNVLIKFAELFGCSVDYILGIEKNTAITVVNENKEVIAVIYENKAVTKSGYDVILSNGLT